MKKKQSSTAPRVNPGVYSVFYAAACAGSRLLCNLHVTGQADIPREGPLLVLASHQGMADFLLVTAAMKGRRVQYVATQRQFRNPKLHLLYRLAGVIPKVQFHTDARCVMSILRTLKGGGTVGLFPAGQTSMCGLPAAIAPSIAHLVRRAGANVCTVTLHGGFFTYPRFASAFNRGRTEAEVALLLTPAQMAEMSEEEIYRRICEKLDYDEYAWQAATGVRFRRRFRAEGLDRVLVRCPRCGAAGSYRVQEAEIRCAACGNRGRVGTNMRITPVGAEDQVFSTLTEWYRWQETQLARRIERPDFCLEAAVTCAVFDEAAFAYEPRGTGVLRLNREKIWYEGGLGETQVCLSVQNAHLPGLCADPGRYVELYHEEYGLVRYLTKELWAAAEIKQAQELLYRRITEESQ